MVNMPKGFPLGAQATVRPALEQLSALLTDEADSLNRYTKQKTRNAV